MHSGNSSVNLPVKIAIEEDEESDSRQEMPSSDFSRNLHTAVKIEENETARLTESPIPAEHSAIKTEEVFIITELSSEGADPPIDSTNDKTNTLFKCYLCDAGKPFEDEKTLHDHLLNSHPQQKEYSCSECSEHRQFIVAFNRHLQRHDPILRPYKCQVCTTRFTEVKNQKRHEAEVHQVKNGLSKRNHRKRRYCHVCKKPVFKEHLDQHLKSEHSDAKVVCRVCQAEFYSKPMLQRHKFYVHGSGNRNQNDTFKCYMCKSETSFDNCELLNQHLMSDHAKGSNYQCKDCGYSCRVSIRYNNHLSRHDPSKKPFKCNICLVRFTEARYLRYHEVSTHNIGGSQEHYDCTICHKQLASSRAWSLHMKIHTSKPKGAKSVGNQNETVGNQNEKEEKNPSSSDTLPPPKCYLCDTTLETDAILKQHIKKTHRITSRDPLFECTQCDFTHKRPLFFNLHLRKHDPVVNPFKCTYCTLRFTTSRYRRFHEITIHGHITTPEASTSNIQSLLRCYLCHPHALLESNGALHKHLSEVHPKQATYSCTHCTYTTGWKRAFNTHQAKHDPDCKSIEIYKKMFPCSVCSKEFQDRPKLLLHQRRMCHAAPGSSNRKAKSSSSTGPTPGARSAPQKANKSKVGYPCTTCRKKFEKNWNRIRHEREVHGAIIPAERNRTTSMKRVPLNNALSCHDPVQKEFKCSSCPRKFLSARSKRCHEIYAHKKQSVDVIKLESAEEPEQTTKTVPFKEEMTADSHQVSRIANSSSPSSIRNVKQLQGVEITKSENCSQDFQARPRVSVAINNIFAASNAAKIYRCHLCNPNHILDSRESLLQHLAALPVQDMYRCDRCGFSVNLVTMFNQHLAQHSTT